jgi:hypothetical protein
MDYIQFRILLLMTVICVQYKIDVLDVKIRHSVDGVVTGVTSWTTQRSNPIRKKVSFFDIHGSVHHR